MVRIRLARSGAKKRPFYHIVATHQQHRRDGRFIERIGFFNPIATGEDLRIKIDMERYKHWQNNGAQPSDRVLTLVNEYEKSGQAS